MRDARTILLRHARAGAGLLLLTLASGGGCAMRNDPHVGAHTQAEHDEAVAAAEAVAGDLALQLVPEQTSAGPSTVTRVARQVLQLPTGVITLAWDPANPIAIAADCAVSVAAQLPPPAPRFTLAECVLDATPTGYVVSYRTVPGGPFVRQIALGKVTTYRVINLTEDTVYYFALQAYGATGMRSVPSADVAATTGAVVILPAAVLNHRVVTP